MRPSQPTVLDRWPSQNVHTHAHSQTQRSTVQTHMCTSHFNKKNNKISQRLFTEPRCVTEIESAGGSSVGAHHVCLRHPLPGMCTAPCSPFHVNRGWHHGWVFASASASPFPHLHYPGGKGGAPPADGNERGLGVRGAMPRSMGGCSTASELPFRPCTRVASVCEKGREAQERGGLPIPARPGRERRSLRRSATAGTVYGVGVRGGGVQKDGWLSRRF